jgi:hypothetical protein
MTLRRYFRLASCSFVLGIVIFAVCPTAWAASWKEKVLYSFQGSPDAAMPVGGVVFDRQGNLYGTALGGPDGTQGTVFQLSPPIKKGGSWTELVIYAFQGKGKNDGQIPSGGLIVDGAGNLYGVTAYGGTGGCLLLGTLVGCGTVYEMSPPKQKGGKWTETILYSLQGGNDGYYPSGTLVFDGAGSLYGATLFGGGFGTCDDNIYLYCGTVFKLSPPKQQTAAWTEKVLYSFKGVGQGKQSGDGANPGGGLVFDSSGAVHGTTYFGGNNHGTCAGGSGGTGCGIVFKLSPPVQGEKWTKTTIHRFNGQDGTNPTAGMIFDNKGFLYGTDAATIFRLTPPSGKPGAWKLTTLYRFDNKAYEPMGSPLLDASSNLYGAAEAGQNSAGSIFRLKPPIAKGRSWTFGILYGFTGSPDGGQPAANLIFGKGGSLYSTTTKGGNSTGCSFHGCGTVFELSP